MSLFERHGHCNICGECCNINNWYGSYAVNPDITFDVDGMCTKQDKVTKKCTIWKDRPASCRSFPRNAGDVKRFPDCGYYFVRKE